LLSVAAPRVVGTDPIAADCYAAVVFHANPVFNKCHFTSKHRSCLHASYTSHLTIKGCTVADCASTGIYLAHRVGATLVGNSFTNTGLSAVEITGPADVTVVRNNLKGSKAGGIYVHDAEDGGG
jgi:hypothetical protein